MLNRDDYEQLVYTLPSRYPSVNLSTLVVTPPGLMVAHLQGMVSFDEDIVLCVFELLDFLQGCLLSYRYEVTRSIPPFTRNSLPSSDVYCSIHYPGKEKLYWYDSQPHPNDPSLTFTYPHHKPVPPDIKHNRVPAPGLSFDEPNLPFLIREIERLL